MCSVGCVQGCACTACWGCCGRRRSVSSVELTDAGLRGLVAGECPVVLLQMPAGGWLLCCAASARAGRQAGRQQVGLFLL
jgi:hypothetical protein